MPAARNTSPDIAVNLASAFTDKEREPGSAFCQAGHRVRGLLGDLPGGRVGNASSSLSRKLSILYGNSFLEKFC